MNDCSRRTFGAWWSLALTVTLFAGPLAYADPPAAPAQAAPPPALTDEQLRIAYSTVLAVGGMQYTYYAGGVADEATGRRDRERLERVASESYLTRIGFKKYTNYAFTLSADIRDALRNTVAGSVTRPFQINGHWGLAVVISQTVATVPTFEQLKAALPKLVQYGALPSPDAVQRPPLAQLYAAARVHNAADLAGLPRDADVNLVLPNGLTMLMGAAATGQLDFIAALLDRKANPNQCASASCPLHIALYSKDPQGTLALLLSRGANPDTTDPAAGVVSTALEQAMWTAQAVAVGELLIGKGANVDGVPGKSPPVVSAARNGDRAAVEMLLRHGADLYKPQTLHLATNALTAAHSSNADPAFQQWLRQTWTDTAKRSGRFDWEGWIEQDGKRTPIADQPIVIDRKPFNVVVRMRPEAQLMVVASGEPKVFAELKEEGGAIHSLGAVVADLCEGAQRPLFLSGASSTGKIGGTRVMAWSQTPACNHFTATQADGGAVSYVRTIGELDSYDRNAGIAASDTQALYVVMGTSLDTIFPSFEYFAPKQFELRFR